MQSLNPPIHCFYFRHYLRKWLKDNTVGDADIREILDWSYYIERIGSAIQKIITIPAALQGLSNPVPRVHHPDWLQKKIVEKDDVLKQRKISELFGTVPKPARNGNGPENIPDIEDTPGPSTSLVHQQGVATVTKRKRPTEEEPNLDLTKTWREALGTAPKIGQTKQEILEWLKFHKQKWKLQLKKRSAQKHPSSKRLRVEPTTSAAAPRPSNIVGFMRHTQRVLLERPWHIVQAFQVNEFGNFIIWAMIDNELHKIKMSVPRIFYVNQRIPAPSQTNNVYTKAFKILPRSQIVHNLYKYTVPESTFQDNQLGLLIDLATPDIEGIYETQMSLEFRLLMELGCVCKIQHSEAKRLVETSKDIDNLTLSQLDMVTGDQDIYLNNMKSLKRIFFYQHAINSEKRSMWGVFAEASKKAIIIVHDTVRVNQLPNLKTLYQTEKNNFIKTKSNAELPSIDSFAIDNYQCTEIGEITRLISKFLSQYQAEKNGPTIVCMQTLKETAKIIHHIPILAEFPQIPIHIIDEASILSGLEWQKLSARTIIRHYINLNTVLSLMMKQCRYFRLPIGNMPKDTMLFGTDLFYSRLLQVRIKPNARFKGP